MMRSMFTGVSGLRTHQTKMDVIANNISNVNTTGFKSSRVTFNEIFSQTVSGATRANETTGRGGTNPMQIGLGVNVASIDKMMGTGAAQRTDRALDLMINGDGFFIVGDNSGQYFTRAGAFDLDANGYLVISNGMKVYGWDTATDDNGNIRIQKTTAAPIQISGEKEYKSPTTTKNIDLAGNLNFQAITNSADKNHVSTMSFYDSLGNRYVLDVTFESAGSSEWTATFSGWAYPDGNRDLAPVWVGTGTGPTDPNDPATHKLFTAQIEFDSLGKLKSLNSVAYDPDDKSTAKVEITLNPGNLVPVADLGNGNILTVNFNDLTQYGSTTTSAKFSMVDGNAPGTLEGLSVGGDGTITGVYSNGESKILGQIPVAIFKNPAGLESYGQNLFIITANSGDFDGTGQETANILGGVLEMSNVDLASEFTEMITTQRGYQASSRLITTSDDMIQELVNLKR